MTLTVSRVRRDRGRMSECAGRAAEDMVRRHYAERGAATVAQRWRGTAGEIDLIFEHEGTTVLVEVKKAATFAAASARVGPRQRQRLWQAAEEYLTKVSAPGLRDCRFDVALVNACGRIEVVENAFA